MALQLKSVFASDAAQRRFMQPCIRILTTSHTVGSFKAEFVFVHNMKSYKWNRGVARIILHTSTTDQTHSLAASSPGKNTKAPTGVWVGFRADLDVSEVRILPRPYWDFAPWSKIA
jgi:hypothetical protein